MPAVNRQVMPGRQELTWEGGVEADRSVGADIPLTLAHILDRAGVSVNGSEPWDIQVRDPQVYSRVLARGSLGFGEAYMDGLWESEALDELCNRVLRAEAGQGLSDLHKLRGVIELLRHRLFNLQTRWRAFQVGERHYDIGNDVFTAMLDSELNYSCGYWRHGDDLEQAQHDKNDLICRKLELQPGDHLLDIGCGWGALARHAARHYGVKVTGVTVSRAQQSWAQAQCTDLPVTIELTDYRSLEGRYDKIASVGMFEHVGPKNYAGFFKMGSRLLEDDGLFLLHTIGSHARSSTGDPWLDRYIFPNGKLPSAAEMAGALDGHFVVEDWHNFGYDYDRTLMAWWKRFEAAWPDLAARYGERFYRMWRYYLLSCAGYFRSGRGQLWQLVLSKCGRDSPYYSLRD